MKMTKRLLSVLLASTFLLTVNVFAEPKEQEEATPGISQEQPKIVPEEEPGGELGPEDLKDEETEVPENDEELPDDKPKQEEVLEEGSNQEHLEDEFSKDDGVEEVPDALSEEALYNEEYTAMYGDPAQDGSIADMVGNNYSNLMQPSDNFNSVDNDDEELQETTGEALAPEPALDENSVLSDGQLSVTTPEANTKIAGNDDIFQVDPVSSPMYFANGNDDSVSLKTGDLMYTKSLFKMPGRNGLDLDLSIRYNSSDAVTTVDEFDYDANSGLVNYRQFAAGWIFNFSNINIADKKSAYGYSKRNSISLADGSAYEFDDDLKLINYNLNDMVLSKDAAKNQYVLTYANGREERFDGTYGNIVQIKDIYGNTIKFEYSEIEYHSGSFFNYIFNVNYYSRKMNLLTKITDSRNKVITLEYGYDSSFSEKRINSIKFLEDSSQPIATICLDTKESSKGKVYTLTSVEDASGYKTTYDYEERQSYRKYDNADLQPGMLHMASCMLLSKVTYPTGGYSTYEYQTARSMHGTYTSQDVFYDWYISYKVSKKSDSSGYAIKYKYENDHTGYPHGHIDLSRDDRRLSVDMMYHTTVCFPGYETVYSFNRNHDLIKEQTYDKNNMVSSHVACSGVGSGVVINGELYRVVSQSTQYIKQTFVYKINTEGETEYLTSIDKYLQIKAVKTYGNYILIFAATSQVSNSDIVVYRFNTTNSTWEQYTTPLSGQTIDFTKFYYSGTMFTYDTATRTGGFKSIRFNPASSLTSNPWSTYTSMDVSSSITYLYSLSGSQYYKSNGTMIKYTPSSSTIEQKAISGLTSINKGVGMNTQAYVYSDTTLYQVNYGAGTLTSLCTLTGFPYNGTIYPDMYGHLYYLAKDNGAYSKIYKVSMSNPETPMLYTERLFSTHESNVVMGTDTMYIALDANISYSAFQSGFEKVKLCDNTNLTYKRSMEYTYNTVHQKTGAVSKIAQGDTIKELYTESYTYLDSHDLPVSIVDKLGNKTTYEYDTTYYLPTKVTTFADTANALVTTNILSADKTKIASTSTAYDDRTITTAYTYDTAYPGNVVMETLSETKSGQSPTVLQRIAYEYGSSGGYALVTNMSVKDVMSNDDTFTKVNRGDAVTKYEYDNFGRLLWTEENGLRTNYTYKDNGWLLVEDYPNGIKKEYNYDSFGPAGGNKVSVSYSYEEEPSFYSPTGYTFYEYYDGLGRVTKRTENYNGSGGEKTLAQFVYDGHNVKTVIDATNRKTEYEYDSFDRQTYSSALNYRDAAMTPVITEYDDYQLTSTIYYGPKTAKQKYQSVTTDIAGRPVTQKTYTTDTDFRTTQTTYDYMGNVSSEQDAKGKQTTYTYNDLGQLIKVNNALSQNTLYEYDSFGNMTKMTTPGGSVTQYEYDNLGRVLKETDAAGKSNFYSYHKNSKDYSKTKDKNGIISSYTYDEDYLFTGMLKSKTIGSTTINYTYDGWRNIAEINDGGSVTSYTYTGNNKLKSKTTPDNKTIQYEYDVRDNINRVTDYSGAVTTYSYDEANRLQKVSGAGASVTYTYNPQNRLQKISYGSSLSAEYAYNNAGEPTSLIRKAGSSTTTFGYSYDLNGNLLQETENGNVVNAYTYDDLNRLATETDKFGTTTTYGFNANGNITSKVMTYAPETSYTLTNAGASYEFTNIKSHKVTMMYNAKNQLQTRSESITGTTGGVTKSMSSSELFTAYTNDGSLKSKKETLGTNLLTKSYWYNDRSQMIAYKENNVTKAEYTYDAEGYRASKIVDGKTTCFYWDRGYTINESDGTSFKAQNVVGLGGIVARKTTGTPTYLFKDVHGDTTMLMQGTSQKGTYDYDAYGKQTEITGTADNPYRYCGEYTDEETGFIYLRNRYYDPSIGRFISEDPAKDGTNWYTYCGNNPIKFVDPWGLDDYIFYGFSQGRTAKALETQLLESDPDTPVHLIYVETKDDFLEGWNGMGEVNGEKVSIDLVVINLHGSPYQMSSSNGEPIIDEDIMNLDKKTIDTLALLSCNTGNLDYIGNVASLFAMSQNVNQVVAPDGYQSSYIDQKTKNAVLSAPLTMDITGETLALSNRQGYGYTLYQRVGGRLFITRGLTRDGQAVRSINDLYKLASSTGRANYPAYVSHLLKTGTFGYGFVDATFDK